MIMLAATLLCLSTKGDGYNPDLHVTVRGPTAARVQAAGRDRNGE